MPESVRAAVGLGSNLGDRLATLRTAAERVAQLAPLVGRSHVWESSPIGGPEQPDFLNAAILIESHEAPLSLLDALLGVEAELGRVRGVRNGPRTIDLDLLWIEGRTLDHPRLVVPHPRLHLRAFALAPLLELVPGAVDPRTGAPYVVPADQGLRALDLVL